MVSRIVEAGLERLAIPFRAPVVTAAGTWREHRMGLVTLVDDEGRRGYGELTLDEPWAAGAWAAADRWLTGIVGRTPGQVVASVDGLGASDGATGSGVAGRNPASRAAAGRAAAGRVAAGALISAALDLAGRGAGRSMAEGLATVTAGSSTAASGPAAGSRRAAASGLAASVAANVLIGGGSIDEVVAASEAAVASGFACLKLKVKPGEPGDRLVERLSAVRAAVGPGVRLRLDANEAWSESEAVDRLRALAPLDLEYVEQPVSAALGPAAMARVRAASPVPVAADEAVEDLATTRALLDAAAVDVVVVKPARVGGPLEAIRIARLAHQHGIATVVSTLFESGVGLAVALQVAAALPDPSPAHGLATAELLADDLLADGPRAVRGWLAVPLSSGGPVAPGGEPVAPGGSGVTVDADAVARHRVADQPPDDATEPGRRLAVLDGELQWSRDDLDRAAARIATALGGVGAGPGGLVAMVVGESAGAIAAIYGVRRIGAALVPLNRRAAVAELAAQLAEVEPLALLYDESTSDLAEAAAAATHSMARVLSIPAILAAAADDSVGPHGTAGLREPAAPDAPASPAQPASPGSDAPASLIFTSGTTGRPKAAILTHRSLEASAAAWAAFLRPAPTDRWLLCLPLHHVAGLGIVDRAARWGVPIVVQRRFDAAAVNEAIESGGITHLSLVGSMLGAILEIRGTRSAPPSLRAILLGGERTPPELVREAALAGLPVVPSYGLTETASGVAALPPMEAAAHPGASGRALPGAEIRVVAAGRGVEPGVIGEIEVRGAMTFAGYRGEPAASSLSASTADGWLRTGDLGSLDADGRLTVADRRDDLVITGGENVYPAEVEAVIRSHPGVVDAAVVGRRDGRWGVVPVAAIVLAPDANPSDAELAAHCRASLAAYKVPVAFLRVAALSRTPSGKLLRRTLRAEVGQMVEAARSAEPEPEPERPNAPPRSAEPRPERPNAPPRAAEPEPERPDAPERPTASERTGEPAAALRHLSLPGARIAYRRAGAGPAIVLFHATLSSGGQLRRLIDRLARTFTVIAVDRRGSGETELKPPPADPTTEATAPIDVATHIADVAAILEAESLGPVLAVGHSFGGCVALELAARRPDLVAGAWVYEPPYGPAGGEQAHEWLQEVATVTLAAGRDEGRGAAAEAFLRLVAGQAALDRLGPGARSRLRAAGGGAMADVALAGLDVAGLGHITCPVEIVTGGASLPFYADIAASLVQRIPGATLATLAGEPHEAPIVDPLPVAASIETFAAVAFARSPFAAGPPLGGRSRLAGGARP